MPSYSFLDVQMTMIGAGGIFTAANGVAEEGIKVTANADKNIMVIGADGKGQHSLVANKAASLTVTLLKTNPQNAILQAMYNIQSVTAALWGKNVITVRDSARGDLVVASEVAFTKQPEIAYSKEGGTVVWEFDAVDCSLLLGSGE